MAAPAQLFAFLSCPTCPTCPCPVWGGGYVLRTPIQQTISQPKFTAINISMGTTPLGGASETLAITAIEKKFGILKYWVIFKGIMNKKQNITMTDIHCQLDEARQKVDWEDVTEQINDLRVAEAAKAQEMLEEVLDELNRLKRKSSTAMGSDFRLGLHVEDEFDKFTFEINRYWEVWKKTKENFLKNQIYFETASNK